MLGPLEVRRGGQSVELRGAKRRVLLALLILHANEVVRTDRLVDELWGEHPPANAPAALQNHVSRLRKALGGDVLVTKPWGYVLRTEPDTIDLRRFETLVAEARTLAAHDRRERLREALALWRGSALADVASEPALVTEVARLEELRLSALEQRIDTDLELGGNRELVAELEMLVAKHPLRERLRGQLILTLYRAGRQGEALEAYRETRRVLVEELGIEPSPELRELEQAILRQDPALVVAAPRPRPASEDEARWRWPRSPFALAAAFLLLGGAGLAAALLVSAGGASDRTAAAPTSTSSAVVGLTARTTAPGTIAATTARKPPAKRPKGEGDSPAQATTATVIGTREQQQPAPQPPPARPITTTRTEQTRQPKPPPARPITTIRAVPATTTTRKTPEPDWFYLLEEDFEDPVFDSLTWRASVHGEGVAMAERGSRLEISFDAGAVPPSGGLGAAYTTQCTFGGDFDAQVDFELLTWPARNGVLVFLSPAFERPAPWTNVSRKGSPPNGAEPERYSTGIYGHVPPEVPTVDSKGTLRVARVGSYITTYYLSYGSWVRLGRAHAAAGDVRLVMAMGSDSAGFGSQTAVAAFDNFRARAPGTTGSVKCVGIPYPPRRPAP